MASTSKSLSAAPAITQFDDDGYDPNLPIEADNDEGNSDYTSSLSESATQSITSSVVDYVYENGRRYHRMSEGSYNIPNDEVEQDRLDLAHHLMLILLKGKLFLAPLENPQRVLDWYVLPRLHVFFEGADI